MKLDIQKFASGTIEFTNWSSGSPIRGKIEWSSNTLYDDNASRVTANLYVKRSSGTTKGRTWNGYIEIAGNVYNFSEIYTHTSTTVGTSWVLIDWLSKTISHNADGSKTIWVGGSITGPSGTTLSDESSWGGQYVTLDKIPRASTPTFSPSPATLGQSVTITTNRVVNTYTHTISYSIGSASGTIAENVGDSTSWSIPLNLANQITTSTSGVCTITTTTYNGTQLIGSTNVDLTLNVPSSVVPSVSIGTLTEADETMQTLNWGVFVQNKSKLNIPITASGSYGSEIVSVVTTINNNTFNGTNIITPTLITSGSNTISTTVTDTRGRTATTTKTYSVVAYSNPTITSVQAQRCTSNGTLSDDGTYILYNFVGSISPVSNHNAKSFKIGYKRTTETNYTYVTVSSAYTVNKNNTVSTFTISASYPYDISFVATDSFMTTTIERDVGTGFDLLNFNPSGKAMAIGKVSEASSNQELLEIALPTTLTQSLSGTSISATSVTGTTGEFPTLTTNSKQIYPVEHSSTEKIIGTFEGATLYAQTYTKTTSSGNNDFVMPSNITIRNLYGVTIQASNNISPLTYYHSSTDWCNWFYRKSNNAVVIRCGSSAGFGTAKFTVEYTKN